MSQRNSFNSLLLSSIIAPIFAVIILAIKMLFFSTSGESASIGAQAGGIGERFFGGLLIMAAIIFVVAFLILRKPRLK